VSDNCFFYLNLNRVLNIHTDTKVFCGLNLSKIYLS